MKRAMLGPNFRQHPYMMYSRTRTFFLCVRVSRCGSKRIVLKILLILLFTLYSALIFVLNDDLHFKWLIMIGFYVEKLGLHVQPFFPGCTDHAVRCFDRSGCTTSSRLGTALVGGVVPMVGTISKRQSCHVLSKFGVSYIFWLFPRYITICIYI